MADGKMDAQKRYDSLLAEIHRGGGGAENSVSALSDLLGIAKMPAMTALQKVDAAYKREKGEVRGLEGVMEGVVSPQKKLERKIAMATNPASYAAAPKGSEIPIMRYQREQVPEPRTVRGMIYAGIAPEVVSKKNTFSGYSKGFNSTEGGPVPVFGTMKTTNPFISEHYTNMGEASLPGILGKRADRELRAAVMYPKIENPAYLKAFARKNKYLGLTEKDINNIRNLGDLPQIQDYVANKALDRAGFDSVVSRVPRVKSGQTITINGKTKGMPGEIAFMPTSRNSGSKFTASLDTIMDQVKSSRGEGGPYKPMPEPYGSVSEKGTAKLNKPVAVNSFKPMPKFTAEENADMHAKIKANGSSTGLGGWTTSDYYSKNKTFNGLSKLIADYGLDEVKYGTTKEKAAAVRAHVFEQGPENGFGIMDHVNDVMGTGFYSPSKYGVNKMISENPFNASGAGSGKYSHTPLSAKQIEEIKKEADLWKNASMADLMKQSTFK